MKFLRQLLRPVPKVFAVLPLAVVAMYGQAANAPTDSDCEDAWTSSSASDSCGEDNSNYGYKTMQASVDTSKYYAVARDNQCYVEVDCLLEKTDVPPASRNFSGSTQEVGNLVNCDGALKQGSC